MKRGLFRDALLVIAPCAAVLAGLSAVSHHQRLVGAGYEVGVLEKERDDLLLEVEHRRVRVAALSSPARLMGEARERTIPLDYPLGWNQVRGDEEAARLLAARAAPKPRPSVAKAVKPRKRTR